MVYAWRRLRKAWAFPDSEDADSRYDKHHGGLTDDLYTKARMAAAKKQGLTVVKFPDDPMSDSEDLSDDPGKFADMDTRGSGGSGFVANDVADRCGCWVPTQQLPEPPESSRPASSTARSSSDDGRYNIKRQEPPSKAPARKSRPRLPDHPPALPEAPAKEPQSEAPAKKRRARQLADLQ